jgi:hypothetical protein
MFVLGNVQTYSRVVITSNIQNGSTDIIFKVKCYAMFSQHNPGLNAANIFEVQNNWLIGNLWKDLTHINKYVEIQQVELIAKLKRPRAYNSLTELDR